MKFSFDQSKPFVIAEISANHAGNLETCLNMITSAKEVGANAVKFQSYSADTITLNSNERDFLIPENSPWKRFRNLHALYDEAKTPREWFPRLLEHAKRAQILAFSSVFSDLEVDLMENLEAPCYKIASAEITNSELLRRVALTKKPVLLSLGVASEVDLKNAIALIRDYSSSQIVVMQCDSTYPAPLEDCNLNLLDELASWKDLVLGYSDHTQGNTSAIVAAAKGATVFEKHFKLSQSPDSVDSFFSADESQLASYISDIHLAFKTFGKKEFRNSSNLCVSHVSIYPSRTIEEGELFTRKNLRIVRPGHGLHPSYWDRIINTPARKRYNIGTRIRAEDLN